jgi:origin recognition complex subunit 1
LTNFVLFELFKQDYSIFENDAILFAAKKTAAMSGDIRKAFQICRGAAELLLRKSETDQENAPKAKHPTVRISDVQKASRESFDSALVTAVLFSSSFQALVLVSLASLCRTTGREIGGFDILDIMTKMESLSGSFGDPQYTPPPAFGETLQLLNRLADVSLLKKLVLVESITAPFPFSPVHITRLL